VQTCFSNTNFVTGITAEGGESGLICGTNLKVSRAVRANWRAIGGYMAEHTQLAAHETHLETSRVHFKNILVAVDFSESSRRALELAVSLADRFGARLVVLHVIQPQVYTPGAEVAWNGLLEAALSDARCRLDESLEAVPGWRDLRHEEIVESGSLLDVMRQIVESHKIDLVICGSHGAQGFERAALGSTAEMILRHMACPVLVAGPNCQVRNFIGGSILLSTSLGLGSYRPAQYAAALAEELNARLTLLHVAPALGPEVSEEMVRHRLCNEVRALLPGDVEDWCHLKSCVLFGENLDCIARVAARERADLIVMGVHEGSRLRESVADHLPAGVLARTIRIADCPVLAVRGHFG